MCNFELARLDNDYETCVVALATGQEAQFIMLGLTDIEIVAESAAAEEIKRFNSGGLGQMLFQRRTDNLIKAHMKDVGKSLRA